MTRLELRQRSAWEDRFSSPDANRLVGGLSKAHASLVNHARAVLVGLPGVSERVSWKGVPWCWTLTYGRADGGGARAVAFVVPRPARPEVCVPVSLSAALGLPSRGTPRFVKEALAVAARVDDVLWPHWELTGKGQFDEIAGLLVTGR